ncbi:Heavy-metal-associated domain protein [Candidatus Burarchaeum australiense]|nr:Heavy-metal-associated domain protein [Candidatus Burarchaeum australiense]
MTKILGVTGMRCRSCEILLRDVIGSIRGVKRVQVDRLRGMVSVDVSDDGVLEDVKTEIEKRGYEVS